MEDWIPGVIVAAPALLASGALFWRVGRLEQDIHERASKESVSAIGDRLTKIEAMLEKINDRLHSSRDRLEG